MRADLGRKADQSRRMRKSVDNCVRSDLNYPSAARLAYGASLGEAEGSQMEWIIESYDRKTDRDGTNRYTTESAFLGAAEELLRNILKGFVSATLPDGRVLDEQQLRGLITHSAPNH
jgi:hypothetical protein